MSDQTIDWREKIARWNGLSLNLSGSDVDEIPEGLNVRFRMDLSNCQKLVSLPRGLKAGTLILSNCRELLSLPEGMEVSFLDISDCAKLTRWPETGSLSAGRLRARNCVALTDLPRWIKPIAQLDLRGCKGITSLPEWLEVSSWIDVADTGITELPPQLKGCELRWKGVPIDERIAFRPDEIDGQEILAVKNAELRRVMLERVGFDRFLRDVDAEVLDRDKDAGGERQLLRVAMEGDEPLVCVSVFCPSTARQYVIRVPPTMKKCHQAIAWTAGFDDPKLYRPLVET